MQILLSTICMALTSAVIGNAYYQKKQFYPAVVHITKSNASMAVIYIQFFVIVFMFGKLLRKIFLGTLRAAEFEHLLERFWYALTEICLAFTVFRDDFNPRFVALFTVLLFLKSFHWLAEERVDFMERSPVIGWLFHLRVASLLAFLGILDYFLLMHAYNSTIIRGPSAQLVFGFEYAILLTIVASTAIKYVLHAAEMRTDTPWENKAVFLLYTELVIGLIKVILYVLFVIIMAKIYALPMFVFRPMFFTIRNFKKALSDVIMSRRAIRNMNTLYPDATPEELRLSDNICIICREDMISNSKKLPCGHIFHTTCLRSWFQRQQTCPTCRLNILNTPAANSTAIPRQENVPAAGAAAAAAGVAVGVSPANIGTPELATAGTPLENVATANPLASNIPTFAGVPGFQTMPIVPPPFMMPPPFPFIAPYGIPPPPMPSDLTKFSDEDLKALEGYERKNIEERIKLLRNIQLMLDAAGILMNNYKIITARMQTPATQVEAPATVKAADSTTSPSVGIIFDEPSTSAAAAAAAAATTFATAANNQTDSVSAHLPVNSMTSITTTIQPKENSPLITSATTPKASPTGNATINKLDEVTIEDLGVEDNEYDFKHAASSSKTTSLATIITTNDDTSELSELRKRRLKFLEEHNKSTSSAD